MYGFGDFLLLMSARLEQGESSGADVLDCLNQIHEAWDRQLDPANEFEAYAALRLCQSMRKILERT